jgi:acetyl esterase
MPLDPQVAAIVAAMGEGWPPADSVPIDRMRTMMKESAAMMGTLDVPVTMRVMAFPGPAGNVPVQLYAPPGPGPFPMIVFFHGGGFVLGSPETHDRMARALVHAAQAVLISVDYRLAPEHPFPAAVEDAIAAVRWVAASAATLNGNPDQLAVAGDSAGAILATVASIAARDAQAPAIAAQLLFYGTGGPPAEMTQSACDYANGPFITTRDVDFYWNNYLPGGVARHDWRAAPIVADLTGLPPTYSVTAECDPTRDDGEAYAQALAAAGVETAATRFEGMPHGFVSWIGILPQAQEAIDAGATFLSKHWSMT